MHRRFFICSHRWPSSPSSDFSISSWSSTQQDWGLSHWPCAYSHRNLPQTLSPPAFLLTHPGVPIPIQSRNDAHALPQDLSALQICSDGPLHWTHVRKLVPHWALVVENWPKPTFELPPNLQAPSGLKWVVPCLGSIRSAFLWDQHHSPLPDPTPRLL